MPFTAQELENIANAALDFHMDQGQVFSSTIQAKPLLREMTNNAGTFPSGKENITVRVKGQYTTEIEGFEGDDSVGYGNPANIKTAAYPWKNIHWGIKVTMDELKKDGITISDTTDGTGEQRHTGREKTALANLLDDKIEDMKEGAERGLNLMYWLDGSQDAKVIPGIQSFIVDDPTAALSVAGIDQSISANSWWRNRANLSINVGSTPSDNVLINFLKTEMRQLRRYGSPKHIALCGSDFLDQLEEEIRAKGNYTLDGWAKSGSIDVDMADVVMKKMAFEYDPTLDDLGYADRCYILDRNVIKPINMEGEYMKRHSPARPADKYVIYRAVTLTGGLVCRQRNTSGVYGLA